MAGRFLQGRRIGALVLGCAVAAGTVALTGCIASGSSRTTTSGRFIGSETLSKIHPGVTTREWVKAVLGQPTSSASLSDGVTEVWKWEYNETKSESGSVFLIAHGSSRSTSQRTVYVEFEGDLVMSAWRD